MQESKKKLKQDRIILGEENFHPPRTFMTQGAGCYIHRPHPPYITVTVMSCHHQPLQWKYPGIDLRTTGIIHIPG